MASWCAFERTGNDPVTVRDPFCVSGTDESPRWSSWTPYDILPHLTAESCFPFTHHYATVVGFVIITFAIVIEGQWSTKGAQEFPLGVVVVDLPQLLDVIIRSSVLYV